MSSTTRRGARGERLVERVGELAQRPAALVAVEADVAARDVVLGEPALAGARDAHDEHDLAVAARAARARGRAPPNAPASAARSPSSSTSVAARAADERAVSGRRAPGIATTAGDEVEQPRERDLGRGHAARGRDLGERLPPIEPRRAARAAERRVRDHRDPALDAALDHAAAERAVVERR